MFEARQFRQAFQLPSDKHDTVECHPGSVDWFQNLCWFVCFACVQCAQEPGIQFELVASRRRLDWSQLSRVTNTYRIAGYI